MKYKTFLLESKGKSPHSDEGSYKKAISVDDAVDLIKKHCKSVDIDAPLYRGMKRNHNEDAYLFEASKGGRVSRNTSNHYTLIIDDLLSSEKKYAPLRGKSIIVTNEVNYAYNYGDAFVIFPYDDTEIGKCEHFDIWESNISFDGVLTGKIDDINDYLNVIVPNPSSYKDIVEGLAKYMSEPKHPKVGAKLYDGIKSVWESWDTGDEWDDVDKEDVVDEVLRQVYDVEHSLGMEFGTYKELDIADTDSEHEFWIGGKCIAIEVTEFKKLKKDGAFE